MSREQIRAELQMLTGIVSEDITYLYYALIKQSQPCSINTTKVSYESNEHGVNLNVNLIGVDSWLAKMEDFNG